MKIFTPGAQTFVYSSSSVQMRKKWKGR